MIKYITGENEGQITRKLTFKDDKMSQGMYDQIEPLINNYPDISLMKYETENKMVLIVINVSCNDDECRLTEAGRFMKYYNQVLSEIGWNDFILNLSHNSMNI